MASVRKREGGGGEKSWKLEGCVERLEQEAGGGRQRKIESACAKGKGSSGRREKGEAGRASMHFGLMANTRRV